MYKKKILPIILTVVISMSLGSLVINYSVSAKTDNNIKIMEYKPPSIVTGSSFQIEKLKDIENVQLLESNEVLTLTKKSEFKNPDSSVCIRYCSIYNLETKQSKDFKDVNIDEFLGVSPGENYVLYAEARVKPKIGSEEWQMALDSGDLLHKNVKLLNLKTGEITDLVTEKLNSDAEFKWVSSNKIIANYFGNWEIIDTTGKVYAQDSYNASIKECPWLAGVDDIKDLGDSVEGKFYYTQDYTENKDGSIGIKIKTFDVKTKEIKPIYSSKNSLHADKKGEIICMDNYYNNGDISADGIYENRTFGNLIIDTEGNLVKEIKLPKGIIASDYVLSPDGGKAVYVESDRPIISSGVAPERVLKVIDTKTGIIKEIIKVSSLEDENRGNSSLGTIVKKDNIYKSSTMSNICWNSTGTAVSFTYGDSLTDSNQDAVDTYIVSFDN